jgi:hypothetical protein
MDRQKPGRPHICGPRHRVNSTSCVLIISEVPHLGAHVRMEMMKLLPEPWFSAYSTIGDYHTSIDGDIVYDVVVYCSKDFERPANIQTAVEKILIICHEAKLILYAGAGENPTNANITETLNRPDEALLADTIRRLLRHEAA